MLKQLVRILQERYPQLDIQLDALHENCITIYSDHSNTSNWILTIYNDQISSRTWVEPYGPTTYTIDITPASPDYLSKINEIIQMAPIYKKLKTRWH